jgi:membrane protease YdiL (CAAX protease family)
MGRMGDRIRHHLRPSLLAIALAGALALAAAPLAGITVLDRLLVNGFALWGGLIGAGASLAWLAAIIGAYRLVDGHAAVDDWLETERRQAVETGFIQGLLVAWLLLTAEELILRGLLLPIGGGVAVVAAAGLWRWQRGRRSTLWGMAHALLLTAVALLSGNLVAAWLTHGITETVWRCYLAGASWRTRQDDAAGAPG